MQRELLEILRCPFCGGRLETEAVREGADGAIRSGVLFCQCCAFPVVDGIPHLRTGNSAQAALHLLGKNDPDGALLALLGVKGPRQEEFRRLLAAEAPLTFQRALRVLCDDAEGTYLLYRFSDPTFLSCRALIQAVGGDPRCRAGRVLDLCGGAGHLTRVLCGLAAPGSAVLADITFWKIWLARRFVAPGCQPVCCDASGPLPFARESFSWVVCSDAFHYIWFKRLLADEMARLAGAQGVITLAHLHNALCENRSAGNPLTPGGYRDLFAEMPTRLLGESELLNAAIEGASIDLSRETPDEELAGEPALALVATHLPDLFQDLPVVEPPSGSSNLRLNPLYAIRENGRRVLERRFPSPEYAAEFSDVCRYLPSVVELNEGRLEGGRLITTDSEAKRLARQHVLLDLPADYLEQER